jgi:type I restriction enzyme S subunit
MNIRQAQLPEGDALNLPKGWEIKQLGDVSQIVNGGTPKSKVKEYWDGNINWITPADLGKLKTVLVDETPRKITGLGLQKSSAKLFPESSIILSTRAPIGHLAINTVPMSTNQGCRGIVPNENLEPWFLYYFLKGNVKLLNDLGSGATFLELSTKNLSSVKIPLPPLPEQQRIVSILDQAFAAIDKAKANAEQNFKNAKELFESYLQGVFENKGDGWEEKRFDEVCVLQRGFDLPTRLRFEGNFPLVSSNGITDRINKCKVNSPGVVTGRSGTIGNVHFIEEDFWPLNTALYIKEFHRNDERFIYYFLTEFDLSKYSSGAGVPTLNRNNVHSVKVSIPKSKDEQKTIVRQLDDLRAETQKMEAVYQKKMDDLDELKKSVLQKAFAGELTSGKEYDLRDESFPIAAEPEPTIQKQNG